MKYRDMKRVVELLENEWDLGEKESGAPRHLCAWIYLMEILEETEQFVYYREKGKLRGIAGYSKNNSNKAILKKKFYTFIKNRLYNSRKIMNKERFKQYQKNYDYTPENLKKYFDGELSILIIDKDLRGKGIGKKLLLDVFELAKEDQMKHLQILTDDSCNYNIYEANGCKKIYETTIKNMEYGKLGNINEEQAFIYDKEL